MKIIVLKLITHEDVLGEVEKEDRTHITIKNPVGIAIVRGYIISCIYIDY